MSKITIQATIQATPAKTWEYYTQPQHITQWNFATPEWHCPSASNDLQVGGKCVARMEAKDGSFGFDFEYIYDEIIENQKIAYTMGDGRKAVVTFQGDETQTAVEIAFDAENQNPEDLQKNGWQAILNNFKAYVEG